MTPISKLSLLGVPPALIEQYTPESMEVTREMALRLGKKISSDIQVAVTGLTAPGGSETVEKPVGSMFVAAFVKGNPIGFYKVFKGSREDIIHQTIEATAEMLIGALTGI